MKKALLFVLIIFGCSQIQAQDAELWQRVAQNSVTAKNQSVGDDEKLYYKLNDISLKEKLSKILNSADAKMATEVVFPNTNGVLERFSVWESSNFDPELQAKFPDIRSYSGVGLDDKKAKIHFSFSPIGLQTMVLRAGEGTEFIESNPSDKSQYVVFASKNNLSKSALVCSTKDEVLANNSSSSKTAKPAANDKVFKTLRLVLTCTGEYAAYFGGTQSGALSGMNATMARVNGILNRDLAVQLILIANNLSVVYTNAATDPYSDASKGVTKDTDGNDFWNKEAQSNITAVIGEANYDIGHLFGRSGGGGNAGCIGCVCVSPTPSRILGKGSAYTSPSDGVPEGDSFDIDYVVHEFGHQLGANHTFSHENEGDGVSVEPGSGSTIMGYAGVTRDYDVQVFSDDYFAYASILQIQNNLSGKTCPVSTAITNNPPIINAGDDFTIPQGTAFVLNGGSSDNEGDTISYCWEQNDSGTSLTTGVNSRTYLTKPDGPMFRSFLPRDTPTRYFPSMQAVLQNRLSGTWESVSSISKTMRFTLTGRDNAAQGTAQTATDLMLVTVNASTGPFAITSQNTDNVSWSPESQQTITWSVNNTTSLVGSSAVNIKLSTDGGLNFSTVLASNTANDGSEVITVPAGISATNCRLLIEPTGNIYYAVNSKPFSIGYTSVSNCNSYAFTTPFSIPNSSSFTTRTISVPASAKVVSDVNVSINVTHPNVSDLEFQIVSPQGTTVKLFYKGCGATNSNLALQFDDSGTAIDCARTTEQIVIPFESLAAFNGQTMQGTWTLRVRDAVSGNSGTLNSASINICDQTYTLGVDDFAKIDFALYPNPNKGNFNVQFESQSNTGVKIIVHDILGKKVYDSIFESTSQFNQNIQLPNPSSGIYIVTVIDGDRKIVNKVVVN